MRLDYKILWLEDQPHNVKEVEDRLRARLSRLGFNLIVDWNKPTGDLNNIIHTIKTSVEDSDLILLDYDLGRTDIDGAKIAKKLRNSQILTDIIFYSSSTPTALREQIFNQNIDGIFCVQRFTLQNEAYNIIYNRIKKILDLNHMRGIVMEVVSDFDEEIINILTSLHNRIECPEEKNKTYNYIQSKIEDSNASNLKQIKKIIESVDGCNFQNLIEHRACGSSIKSQILKSFLEKLLDEYNISNIFEIINNYDDQVIKPRNSLAHAKPIIEDGKLIFKVNEKTFGENEFQNLRQNLLTHRDNFTDLKALLTNGNLDSVKKE